MGVTKKWEPEDQERGVPTQDAAKVRRALVLEFRRGTIILAALAGLQQERYGLELIRIMAEHGLEIEEFTLYPLLRRLGHQGPLQRQWRIEDNCPKRFYQLSHQGREFLREMLPTWRSSNASVEALFAFLHRSARRRKEIGPA